MATIPPSAEAISSEYAPEISRKLTLISSVLLYRVKNVSRGANVYGEAVAFTEHPITHD